MVAVFVNACRFNPTAGGTADWTFSSAVTGYNSPALAGILNGATYKYRAESTDLSQWEIGEGTYNTSSGVLTRTSVLQNSSGTGLSPGQSGAGTKINFSSAPQVAIVALAEDLRSIIAPQGRLTLVSGTAVMSSDQVGATSIYYAPAAGRYVSLYDGTAMQLYPFTSSVTDTVGLTLALGSNWGANTIFDVFVTLNNGVPVLATIPWSASGAGVSSRATALAPYNGLMVNATSATARISNTTTITMGQFQGTYVGSFFTAGSAGTIDFKLGSAASGGGAAVLSVYNPYNQVLQEACVRDSVTSYTYTTASYRQANASSGNQVTFLVGLGSGQINIINGAQVGNSSGGLVLSTGVGIDSTTVNSAQLQFPSQAGAGASAPALSIYTGALSAGLHYAARLEYSQAAGTTTWFGTAGVTGIQSGMTFQWLN